MRPPSRLSHNGPMPRTDSTGSDSLPLRRRFAGIIDEDGEPTVGWEVDTRGDGWRSGLRARMETG